MCFHFLDTLTLMGVSNGVGLCLRGKFARCNAALRRYLNLLKKWDTEKTLNWCVHMIVSSLGLVWGMYVGKHV